MPNVASPTYGGSRPRAACALQHDGLALLRLAADAAADITHIVLVLFLVACSLVRKVGTAPHGRYALTCDTHTARARPSYDVASVPDAPPTPHRVPVPSSQRRCSPRTLLSSPWACW